MPRFGGAVPIDTLSPRAYTYETEYASGRLLKTRMSSDAVEVGVGKVVEGTVTGITHFGAFVALPNGKTGLVHISEVADAYVKDIKDYLHDNDVVKVRVLSMDDNGKIGLSIRQAQEPRPDAPPREVRPPREPNPHREGGMPSHREGGNHRRGAPGQFARGGGSGVQPTFEDKLQRFMRDSEDRLQDLKRSTESKRGGRGAGR